MNHEGLSVILWLSTLSALLIIYIFDLRALRRIVVAFIIAAIYVIIATGLAATFGLSVDLYLSQYYGNGAMAFDDGTFEVRPPPPFMPWWNFGKLAELAGATGFIVSLFWHIALALIRKRNARMKAEGER